MSDKRGYDLATEHSTWDGDAYFNIDKAGFARAKKYRADVLKGHLKVGDQQYTEENYVTNDETLTASVDKLDVALKVVSDVVDVIVDDIISKRVVLSSSQVAALGEEVILLPVPLLYNAYQLIDIKWAINPTTALDVGGQSLEIYFDGITKYLGLIRADGLEQGVRYARGVQIQGEHELGINKAVMCKLSGDTNPTGQAGMTFYFIYKSIVMPALT
jgi:hypothetical protein